MAANDSGTASPDDPFDVWYAPQLDYSVLRTLMRRTDLHGLTRFTAWIALCGVTGSLVVMSLHSWWLIPAMIVHGCALSFSYAGSHECAHGTAFRTRWLNEALFWLTSLVFIEEPLYRRYSHAGHHTYTWFNALDPQKPYGIPMRFSQYITVTLGLNFYFEAARQLARHSLGRFTEAERAFLPSSEVRKVAVNSRIMAACYLALLLWGIALREPVAVRAVLHPASAGRLDHQSVHQYAAHVHGRGSARSSADYTIDSMRRDRAPAVLEYELSHRASSVPHGAVPRPSRAESAHRQPTAEGHRQRRRGELRDSARDIASANRPALPSRAGRLKRPSRPGMPQWTLVPKAAQLEVGAMTGIVGRRSAHHSLPDRQRLLRERAPLHASGRRSHAWLFRSRHHRMSRSPGTVQRSDRRGAERSGVQAIEDLCRPSRRRRSLRGR